MQNPRVLPWTPIVGGDSSTRSGACQEEPFGDREQVVVYLQQSERPSVERQRRPQVCRLPSRKGHPGHGREEMFVRIGLGECAIILVLLLIVIAVVALGIRQRGS